MNGNINPIIAHRGGIILESHLEPANSIKKAILNGLSSNEVELLLDRVKEGEIGCDFLAWALQADVRSAIMYKIIKKIAGKCVNKEMLKLAIAVQFREYVLDAFLCKLQPAVVDSEVLVWTIEKQGCRNYFSKIIAHSNTGVVNEKLLHAALESRAPISILQDIVHADDFSISREGIVSLLNSVSYVADAYTEMATSFCLLVKKIIQKCDPKALISESWRLHLHTQNTESLRAQVMSMIRQEICVLY